VPTPESVLQTILQQTQAAQDGAPTRPMQFSAAAFQAPAPVDAQPVTFRDTDTEPNMRPAPPMPTLEQIAVFSGPLAFNHPHTGEIGSSLRESAPDVHWAAGKGQWETEDEPTSVDSQSPQTTSVSATSSTKPEDFDAPVDSAQALTLNDRSLDDMADDIMSAQSEPLDLPIDLADVMGYMMTGAPDLSGGPLPLPGTLSSGPLLAASQYGPTDTRALSQQSASDTDTGGLSTQYLHYDASTDDSDSDRPTDINLGQYPVPPSKSTRSGNSSGASATKSQTSRSSGGSSSGRPSQPRQSGDDPISKMKKLKQLLDAGFITEADYEAKKADILARFF
jgi:Short C-terminal domain